MIVPAHASKCRDFIDPLARLSLLAAAAGDLLCSSAAAMLAAEEHDTDAVRQLPVESPAVGRTVGEKNRMMDPGMLPQ